MKGTGKWTVQQAFDLYVVAPSIAASLDSRFLSGLKEEKVEVAKVFKSGGFDDVRQALYASKNCSYAQGMNLIRAKRIVTRSFGGEGNVMTMAKEIWNSMEKESAATNGVLDLVLLDRMLTRVIYK
ncbi:hypothetical protein V6N13_131702 [Hibiscus sabdariffa]